MFNVQSNPESKGFSIHVENEDGFLQKGAICKIIYRGKQILLTTSVTEYGEIENHVMVYDHSSDSGDYTKFLAIKNDFDEAINFINRYH